VPNFSEKEVQLFSKNRKVSNILLGTVQDHEEYPFEIKTEADWDKLLGTDIARNDPTFEQSNWVVDNNLVEPQLLESLWAKQLPAWAKSLTEEQKTDIRSAFEGAWLADGPGVTADPKRSEAIFQEFRWELENVMNGKADIKLGSISTVQSDVMFEDLVDNNPLFSHLNDEQKIAIAENYDLSLGEFSPEFNWPVPLPAHTWVELPVIKLIDTDAALPKGIKASDSHH
jgi:hypothetical protein